MHRLIFCLFCILSFSSAIEAFECDEEYELTEFEEDNIEDEREIATEKLNFSGAKSIYKQTPQKDLPDSNSAMATLEAGPSATVAGCVNAITGAYFDTHVPLTIAGAVPLTVQCTYCSSEKRWRFQHMPKLMVGYSRGQNHLRASYLDDNGSGMAFDVKSNEKYPSHGLRDNKLSVPDSLFEKGLTNCGSGEISGKTNWRNAYLSLVKKVRNLDKKSYALHHGSNIKRVFSRYKKVGDHGEAPTGKFRLTSEQHPNSNRLLYKYNADGRLRKIQGVNQANESLAYLDVEYHPKANVIHWKQGENRADMAFVDDKKKKMSMLSSSQGITIFYRYENDLLRKKILPEESFLEIDYYADREEKGRVKQLITPVGVTHTFNYNVKGGASFVFDAEKNLTGYYYDIKTKQLTSIIRCDDKKNILTRDAFYWSNEKSQLGNLIARTYGDAKNIYFSRTLDYDDYGNVICDSLFGNLTGKSPSPLKVQKGVPVTPTEKFVKTYNYSRDGRNLLLEEHEAQKSIFYSYYPKTLLLEQRLTKNKQEQVLKREFFEYDKNGVLVKEIWDDGKSPLKDDLLDVTERHVKVITPRSNAPIGLPEVIEEHYLDLASGQYRLLKKTVNDYSPEGKLLQEDHYDSNGNFSYSLKWKYDRLGNIEEKTDALGQTTIFGYDGNSNKIREEGPFPGWHKEFKYDHGNRLFKETEYWPNGTTLITRHDYNILNQRISTTDPHDQQTTFTYDPLGRLERTEGPGLFNGPASTNIPFEEIKYDAMGNPIIQQDANGYITKSAFTIRGKPYRIEHPDGSVEQKEYSLSGLLVKEIAKNGLITQYAYDPFDRIISTIITDPQGNILKTKCSTYSTFHLLTETDEEGYVTIYEYDGAGRRTAMKKGNHCTQYEYDSLSRNIRTIETIDNNHSRIICKDYDFLNRVIEERIEDGSGQVFKKEQYTYDTNNKRTSVTVITETGKATTKTEYTPDGKPLLITDALGNQTRYIYDHHFFYKGQTVLAVTKIDPSGNREVQVHDTHGNICWQAKADAFGRTLQEERLFYDPLGQKTLSQLIVYQGHEENRMIQTTWQYDCMGNMYRLVEAEETPEKKVVIHTFNLFGQKEITFMPTGTSIIHGYDSLGRLHTYQSTDNTIYYRYHYDAKDRPILVEDLIHHTVTKRAYNEYGNLISETLDNGLNLTYTYDQIDRPLSVTLPDQSSIRYRYNAHHLIAVERIKAGEVAYTHHYPHYDLAGNVLEETLLGQAGAISYQYDLLQRPISLKAPHWQESIPKEGFDSLGNLLKREVTDKQGPLTYTYAYDLLNQLISEEGFVSHTYANDSIYNRTAKDTRPYTVNALNQLKSQTNCTYDYDNNGNLKIKTADSDVTSYTYDALDRLIKVCKGPEITTYTYDSFHRRLSKSHDGIVTRYIYHGQNELGAVIDEKINELRVLGLSHGAEIGGAVALELNDNIYAPIHDPQGNIVSLVDPDGKLIEHYRYSAFGETQVFSEVSINNPWRFSSKRYDPETGFIYFGRRYYDPEVGRWTTSDPASFADGPNLYAYVHNHPLAYIDPDGQFAFFLLPIAISIAADYFLPAAVACIEPYTGVMVGSFLTGLVKGYNCDYSLGGITDPSCQLSATLGLTLGTFLNINPKGAFKAGAQMTKTVTQAFTSMAQREGIEAFTSLASKKVTQICHWSKPYNPLAQITRKTSQAAENCLAKEGMKKSDLVIKETLQSKGMVTSRYRLSASEALEVGEKFLGPGYKEIGKAGSGVFRNGQRQFRIDANSLLGKHKPWESHIHLETFKLGDKHPSIINHILIYE